MHYQKGVDLLRQGLLQEAEECFNVAIARQE